MNRTNEPYTKKLEWVGMLVPILTTIAYGSEIHQITHEKDAKELNWLFLICLLIIGILWFIYGYTNKITVNMVQGVVVIISNIINCIKNTLFNRPRK